MKTLEFVRSESGGRELIYRCPKCTVPDTTGHLYINPEKGLVHCFRCSFASTVTALRYHGIAKPVIGGPSRPTNTFKTGVLALPREAVRVTMQDCPKAYSYLLERGLTPFILTSYDFYYCNSGVYRGRVIVPVREDNQLVYFTARMVPPAIDKEPKYRNPPVPKQGIVFNLDKARVYDKVIICEGIFSSLAVGEHSIALLGKTMDAIQRRKIATHWKEVTLFLDGDAHKQSWEMAEALWRAGCEVRVARLEYGEDPASITADKRYKALDNAVLYNPIEHMEVTADGYA